MTIKEAKARRKLIEESIWDAETAHQLEDALKNDFISAIINYKLDHMNDMYVIALELQAVTEMDFPRWYA